MTNSLTSNDIKISHAGENSVIIYFSERVSPQTSLNIKQMQLLIINSFMDKIIDLVPSYASILVVYDQLKISHQQVEKQLQALLTKLKSDNNSQYQNTLVHLPVYYSTESGPDLLRIAKNSNLSVNQVIEFHCQQEYQVYAIGFAPGFAYLGEVNQQIATPRLTTPRLKVPRGAVGIADKQTAVYPSESPGGWNIIGLCPTDMFNANSTPVTPIQVGDTVKFNAISKQEFLSLGGCLPSKI